MKIINNLPRQIYTKYTKENGKNNKVHKIVRYIEISRSISIVGQT